MRYIDIRNIEFTNINGKTFKIKDRREIPNYTLLTKYSKDKKELGDEIAVKREIFGEGSESLTYRIYEANIIALIENRFNFEKLKIINIPRIED